MQDDFLRESGVKFEQITTRINTECLSDFGSAQFAPAALRCALVVTQ
jgi:hypothetical protein